MRTQFYLLLTLATPLLVFMVIKEWLSQNCATGDTVSINQTIHSSHLFLFNRDRRVRHCVTGSVMGRIQNDLNNLVPLSFSQEEQAKAMESSKQRRRSFIDVFKRRRWGDGKQHEHKFMASGEFVK